MDHMKFWSRETNPETGERFEYVRSMLANGSNGKADLDAMVEGPYGVMLTEALETQFRVENDPFGPAFMAYFEGLGLKPEMHDDGDYYGRWATYTPAEAFTEAGRGKKYPMVIYNIPLDMDIAQFEFRMGLEKPAGRDKFIIAYIQNTNWDNVSLMIDRMAEQCPVDRERVYITGFSYGGYQATAAYLRVPWKFAGCAPCGNDIWREWDNWRIPYTDDEVETLRHLLVPFIQIVGECEASNFAPLNDYSPRTHDQPIGTRRGKPGPKNPRANPRLDPCVCPQRKLPDGTIINTPVSMMPRPAEGEDKHLWALGHLNKRLYTLGCAPRDIDRCLSYLNTPEDELHHVLGFYADREEIRYIGGHKHYIADIDNAGGMNTFRYVVWANGTHQTPVTMGELIWDFFRQFRRDTATGRIVADRYEG